MSLSEPCRPHRGRPSAYQHVAFDAVRDRLTSATPWVYITPLCETRFCLTGDHLSVQTARKLAYPSGVCVYCGVPGHERDHLLPVTSTSEARRQYVAIVPACRECNTCLSERFVYRITDRRAEAHRSIRRRYARYIDMTARWPEPELAQLGYNLRQRVESGLRRAEWVNARLAWPEDAAYDVRAFEKSGIADPIGMGLL